MELSRRLFTEIVGVNAESVAVFEPQGNRRKHTRIAFGSRARIFPLMEAPGQEGCLVLVRDISRGGVGFLFDEPMAVGDEFIIHLPRLTSEPIQIHSIVQRCTPGGTGGTQFAIGATFELVLNSDEPLLPPGEHPEEPADETAAFQSAGESFQTALEEFFDQIMKGPPAPVRVMDTRLRRLGRWLCTWTVIGLPVSIASRGIRFFNNTFDWALRPTCVACKKLATALHIDRAASPRIRHRLRPNKTGKRRQAIAPSKLANTMATAPMRAAVQTTAATNVQSVLVPIIVPPPGGSSSDAINPARISLFAPPAPPAPEPIATAPQAPASTPTADVVARTVLEPADLKVVDDKTPEAMPRTPAQTTPAQPPLVEKTPIEMKPEVQGIESAPMTELPAVRPVEVKSHDTDTQETRSLSRPDHAFVVLPESNIPGAFLLTGSRPAVRGNGGRHPRRRNKAYFRFSTGTKSVLVGPV